MALPTCSYVPAIFLSSTSTLKDVGITRVVTHHEVAAAYMAEGYARISRRPAVCMAQQVGVANLAAGLRDGFLASSPIIAVTGGVHPDNRYQYLYQMMIAIRGSAAEIKNNPEISRFYLGGD
jgi:acetolactate synthase-1/2/3 large subunit